MEKSSRITLRCTPAEKEAWEKAASGRLSDWLRDLANGSLSRWVEDEPLPRITTQPAPRPTVPGTTAESPRWMHHRKGVYCGSCGK